MKSKRRNLFKKNPSCTAETERRGEKTREGVRSVVDILERRKHGEGMKGLDDKSIGMEILMAEAFTKIEPTDPFIRRSLL
jgi:hypothetical protein